MKCKMIVRFVDIKWLTMFFLKRDDVSQSSVIEGLRWEMTAKRPRVLKKTSLVVQCQGQ
jgi:hypothetical protein